MLTGRLDIELLEAFVAIADTGSFTRAGNLLHRTQPAVSMQIKRLEQRVGKMLINRSARQFELTGSGIALLSYAKNIVELSREARLRVSMPELKGIARVGNPEWFATDQLKIVFCNFARAHPNVRLDIHVNNSVALRSMIADGALDLALAIHETSMNPTQQTWEEPLYWAAGKNFTDTTSLVPLVLFSPPCPYRKTATQTLEKAKRGWREVLTSTSVAVVRAALLCGLGVSVLPAGAARGLRRLNPADGFPELPPTKLAIYTTNKHPTRTITFLHGYLSEHVGNSILNVSKINDAEY